MKILFALLASAIAFPCLAAVSFDDVMVASRHASQVCEVQGDQSIPCIVANHQLQLIQEHYDRDQRDAEISRSLHADGQQQPLTAEEKVRESDVRYLDAYANGGGK